MAKLNRQEKSDLNRVIHKAAQSFAHQASLITIARGRNDMAARLVWRGDVLDVEVLVDQPNDTGVASGRDEFEPF